MRGRGLHPHPQPALVASERFVEANRQEYHVLSDAVAVQYPPHRQLLEDRYLELTDGGCSLPVAYVLGYGYTDEGRTQEWIAKLDERVADAGLSGDARATWLLARAAAEEIRLVAPVSQRHGFPMEHNVLGGRSWLETALLEAQSEAVQLAAYRELVATLAAGDQTRASALTLVDQAAERLPQSRAELGAWRTAIEDLDRGARELGRQQEEQAQRAYLDALRQRHQQAAARGRAGRRALTSAAAGQWS